MRNKREKQGDCFSIQFLKIETLPPNVMHES